VVDPQPHGGVHVEAVQPIGSDPGDLAGLAAGGELAAERPGREADRALLADLAVVIPEFLAELDRERARGRTTYAEVEENEADLHRFQSWLAKIAARDYFDAPGAAEAQAAVERCATELAAFEEDALAAEAPEPNPTPVPGQRHLHIADANELDA
jgi:hypothetical protein